MNKRGETIVLKVNKDKGLAGFYAMGFDPTVQLMQLMMVTGETSEDDLSKDS